MVGSGFVAAMLAHDGDDDDQEYGGYDKKCEFCFEDWPALNVVSSFPPAYANVLTTGLVVVSPTSATIFCSIFHAKVVVS